MHRFPFNQLNLESVPPGSEGADQGNHCHTGAQKNKEADTMLQRPVVAIHHLDPDVGEDSTTVEKHVNFRCEDQGHKYHVGRKALCSVVAQILAFRFAPRNMLSPDL